MIVPWLNSRGRASKKLYHANDELANDFANVGVNLCIIRLINDKSRNKLYTTAENIIAKLQISPSQTIDWKDMERLFICLFVVCRCSVVRSD